jgi:2,5-dihydroxypyridine 5,6-dioxygenase
MRTLDNVELVKYLKTPFKLNSKPGDKALIITDTAMDSVIWECLMTAAYDYGVRPNVAIMTPRHAHQAEPDPPVAAALVESDIIILLTSKALAHTNAVLAARKKERRVICMEEATVDVIVRGPGTADYDEMKSTGEKIQKIMTEGKKIHVTTEFGTDIQASIEGRMAELCCGIASPPWSWWIAAFPDGEVPICPIEGTAEGTIVFDTSMHGIGLFKEPITVKVEKGRVVSISGGIEAAKLRQMLETQGDENTYCIGEFAPMLNPKAVPCGIMRQDKKIRGGIHIALGRNDDFGGGTPGIAGTIHSKIHLDGVMRKVTCKIDNKVIVKDGQIVV